VSRRWLGAARRTFRWTRWLALALLLPALLAAGFGKWWLLPRLNEYRSALAAALGDYLRAPAQIEAVAAERDGWRLGLRLQGVSLHDPATGAALIGFQRAAASLDLWRSLREQRPVFNHIRLEGVSLTLEQGIDGIPRLRAEASPPESAPSLPEVARWLFTVGRLDILGDRLTVRRRDGGVLNMLHPYFQVRDTGPGQRLAFSAEPPAELGDRLQLSIERPGTDPESWRGTLEVRAGQSHSFEWNRRGDQWQGRIQGLRIQDMAVWGLPWLDEPARQWLAALAPRGELPELTVQTAAAGSYAITASLREAAFRPAHDLPGFDPLTGTLELTSDQGRIVLDSRKIRVDTAGLLRAPVTLDTLTGTVNWTRAGDGWRLTSAGLEFANADLKARVWGDVTIPASGAPVLDVHARYRDVKISAARRYLPVTVIPPDGVAWLDRALVGGQIPAGEGVLRGPAPAFHSIGVKVCLKPTSRSRARCWITRLAGRAWRQYAGRYDFAIAVCRWTLMQAACSMRRWKRRLPGSRISIKPWCGSRVASRGRAPACGGRSRPARSVRTWARICRNCGSAVRIRWISTSRFRWTPVPIRCVDKWDCWITMSRCQPGIWSSTGCTAKSISPRPAWKPGTCKPGCAANRSASIWTWSVAQTAVISGRGCEVAQDCARCWGNPWRRRWNAQSAARAIGMRY